ncbi:MAG: hypothetical protein KAH14_02725 [Clostridiales bacterium]|nr:hypothetical protein [Clostridiales bacterium]
MIYAIILFVILTLLTVYSIVREELKRRQLGNTIMKVNLGIKNYLSIAIWLVLAFIVVYFIINGFYEYNLNADNGILRFGWSLTINSMIFLAIINGLIRLAKSREIREKGVSFAGFIIYYSDLKSINWLDENKIEITYSNNVSKRLFKEKWTVKDYQVTELKRILQEKYYDSF